MADLDDLPDLTDGATPITTGTAVDEAWWDLVQAALLGELRGATDPTRTSAQNIDEVLAARGAFGTLLARLTDWEARQYVTPVQVRNGFVLGNLLANDTFAMWSRGDAAAPDYWSSSGSPTIARCGVGQADTTVLTGMDHFSCKLTYGAAAGVLYQDAISAATLARLDQGFLNRYRPVDASATAVPGYEDDALCAYLIGHVKCGGVNVARLRLDASGTGAYSPYHPGDGTWYTLIAPLQHSVSVGRYQVQCRVEQSGSAHFQGLSLILAPLGLPPMYVPARVRLREYTFPIIATPAAATGYGYFVPSRPFHALGLTASVLGAVPTGGTTLKLDLMTPIGGVFQSLFTTLPAFVASDRHLIQACDPAAANYRRLTTRGVYAAGGAASLADNSVLRLDVNARDSGATATNVLATVIGFEYDRPLDQFRTMTDLGE